MRSDRVGEGQGQLTKALELGDEELRFSAQDHWGVETGSDMLSKMT